MESSPVSAPTRAAPAVLLGRLAVAMAACGPALAATPVPEGKWSFVFTDARGRADRPMRVYTYRPRQCDESCPIQFVLHGVKRNASDYRDHWERIADRYGLLVVAPEFSRANWPRGAGYSRGDVDAGDDRERWAFAAIEHLFDEVRTTQKDYRLFGHSAGGQFAQRFHLFMPGHRAAQVIAANPGWYTLPEWRADRVKFAWPHSLAGAKVGEPEVRQAFSRRFWLLLGEADTDAGDPNLDQSEGSNAQGENRLARGEHFFAAATTLAREMGVPLQWQLSYVAGTAHDGARMSRAAADLAYGARP